MSYICDDDFIYILDSSEPSKVKKDVYINHHNVAQHAMRICMLSLEAAILAQKTQKHQIKMKTDTHRLLNPLVSFTSSLKTLITPLWIKEKIWTVELEQKAISSKVSPN